MPESGKEDLSYSHLHQGSEDKKQSYSYCDVSEDVMLSNTIVCYVITRYIIMSIQNSAQDPKLADPVINKVRFATDLLCIG